MYGALLQNPEGPFQGKARVETIWGEDFNECQKKGAQLKISRVCQNLNEALRDVDAVLVLGRFADSHFEPARLSLEKGLPTYVDKWLAGSYEEAKALVEKAESKNVPLSAFSPYRKYPFIQTLRTRFQKAQGSLLTVQGPLECNDLKGDDRFRDVGFYGIHSLEMGLEVLECESTRPLISRGEGTVSALIEGRNQNSAHVRLISGLDGESYTLLILNQNETLIEKLKIDEAVLYTEALLGIWNELIEKTEPSSARSNLMAIKILDEIREKEWVDKKC